MSLKIHGFNTYSETMFYLNCPQCGHSIETNVPKFLMAINLETPFFCVDCGCGFRVEFVRLIRQPEQRNDADSGIPEALCDDVEHSLLKSFGDKFCGACGTPLLP